MTTASFNKQTVMATGKIYRRLIDSGSKTYYKGLYVLWILLSICLPAKTQEFTTYNEWNFENRDLGTYTEQEINEDFNVGFLLTHNTTDIVEDVINGDTTKVLRIRHDANKLNYGLDLQVKLDEEYDEIYMSYDFKFSKEFNSTSGGKLPGFLGFPTIRANECPDDDGGFVIKNLFKQAGSITTYHYDRTTQWCPWATERYNYDTIYFNNGCWYNITKRLKMNTFTNGVPNGDGIHEVWIDGRMIFKETNLKIMSKEDSTMRIDGIHIAHWYGGGETKYIPLHTCYGYIDNIKVWKPVADSTWGTFKTHDGDYILPTPDEITDREVYYDSLRTTEGILSNTEFGDTYSPCIDETYLIDAGEGNRVAFTVDSCSLDDADYLFFYNGNTTDAHLITMLKKGSVGDKTIKSSGRYMFIRFSTNRLDNGFGWTGEISFEDETTGYSEKRTKNASEKIKLFPNPGTNTITIKGINDQAELAVFNILGKKVLHKRSVRNNEELDTSGLPLGIYTILVTDKDIHTLKFIKN